MADRASTQVAGTSPALLIAVEELATPGEHMMPPDETK